MQPVRKFYAQGRQWECFAGSRNAFNFHISLKVLFRFQKTFCLGIENNVSLCFKLSSFFVYVKLLIA